MDDWLQYIIGAAAAILGGGGLAAIFNWLNSRKKVKSEIAFTEADTEKKEAETTEIITRAAGAAAEMLSQQLKILRSENATMHCEIEALQKENKLLKVVQQKHEQKIIDLQAIAEQFDQVLDGAHTLYGQVIELNGEPKYKPPARRKGAVI